MVLLYIFLLYILKLLIVRFYKMKKYIINRLQILIYIIIRYNNN